MPRHVVMSLDMELAWSAHQRGQTYRRPRPVAAICARWGALLRLLPGWQDAAPLDEPYACALLAADPTAEVLCWGLTPALIAAAPGRFPRPEAVLLANTKLTSHALSQTLGVGLPHAQLIPTEAALHDAIAATPCGWWLKHPLGVSGREAIHGAPHTLDPRALAWARRHLPHTPLILEPRLDDLTEWSWHFDLSPDGTPTPLGTVTLHGSGGALRGHTLPCDVPFPHDLLDPVAAHLHTLGYFGPVSVDAMRGRHPITQTPITRPISEINARFTFGRMALELRHHAPPHTTLRWHHPTARERGPQDLPPLRPDATIEAGERLFALPEVAEVGEGSGTWVVCSPIPGLTATPCPR